ESKSALQQAKGGVSGLAAGDVRQAIAKDDVALENLRPRPARDPELAINIGIVRKEAALKYVDNHVATSTVPNKPPKITEFSASFVAPVTTYQVIASDPDDSIAKLKFTWKKQQQKPCGVFTPRG